MGLVSEQSAFLLDACKLIEFANSKGFVVTGGELWRTQEQQKIYYETGKSKTMNSWHLRRLAIDLNFFDDKGGVIYDVETLRPVGEFWQSLNPKNSWGGFWQSFKDVPHFERRI